MKLNMKNVLILSISVVRGGAIDFFIFASLNLLTEILFSYYA